MSGERLTRTFLLALIGLALFALLRPASPDPREDVRAREAWFFINKTHQPAAYDAVVIGDSRGLRGISTEVLSAHLPERRIFNFSFNAGGMNPEMYGEAERLLDPRSPAPLIVLAPTALSLMDFKRANSQFHEYRAKPRDQVWLYTRAPRIAQWFQPVSPSIYLRRLLDLRPTLRLEQEFHRGGWIETTQVPLSDLSDLSQHRERLAGNAVDPLLIADLMTRTADWTARGIRVACFFPPAYPAMTAMEDSMLGFDRGAFREAFVRAGGLWLDVPQTGYDSYDGSHLTGPSARRMSDFLGRALVEALAAPGS